MKGTSRLRTWLVGMTATLMILMGVPCAAQVTLIVDTLDDVVDESDDYLSLREALEVAGTYDTIEFDPALLPGTIYLDPAIGTLFVDQDVTIAGPGPELLTIDGQCTTTNEYSVFTVGVGYTMTDAQINGLTITRGGTMGGGGVYNNAKLSMSNCVITNCRALVAGAVFNDGEMTMNDCVMSNCIAQYGGAIANSGVMTLENCNMANCSAEDFGGAVINVDVMLMTGCNLTQNSAYAGGAVHNVPLNNEDASLTMEDCHLGDNGAMYYGGALMNGLPFASSITNRSDVALKDCTFTGNIVVKREYSWSNPLGMGGAICDFTWIYDTSLTIDSCVLSNNAAAYGGAICITSIFDDDDEFTPAEASNAAVVSIVNSTLTNNLAWVHPDMDPYPSDAMAGGAIAIISAASLTDLDNTSVTIDQCTLDGNAALGQYSVGGAIAYSGNQANTDLNITNSTVSNNTVEGSEVALGGGILLMNWQKSDDTSCSLITKISNSTLSGNSVVLTGEPTSYYAAEAGCIYNEGDLFIDNCTLADNVDFDDNPDVPPSSGIFTQRNPEYVSGGALSIKNTILANDPSGRNINSNMAEVTSHGYNISSDDSSLFLDDPTDMNNTDPMLGLLADNGGPTQTHLLLAGSPALNAASSTDIAGNPVVLDQRGVVRPQGSANDIGAVEMEQMVQASALDISKATVVRERKTIVITIQITNGQAETARDNLLTTASLGGISCVERLPARLGTIMPGKAKEWQLTFKNVLPGEATLVIEGTSSLGDFWSTQTVHVP